MNESTGTTTWDFLSLFSNRNFEEKFAIVVLNRRLKLPISFYSKLWSNSIYKTAADGGANRLYELVTASPSSEFNLDSVIGDLDSLHSEARKYWEDKGALIIHDPGQDSTDLTKAIEYIRRQTSQESLDIVVLGDIGGRVDHGLSVLNNLHIQQKPFYTSGKLYLLSNESITFILQSGNHTLTNFEFFDGVNLGKHVGIIPFKEPSIISTYGLEWDVRDWKTKIGGQVSTSNHVKSTSVSIQTSKDVIFTIELKIISKP